MRVYLRFSAAVANLPGTGPMEVELPEGATMKMLLDYMFVEHPLLAHRIWAALPIISGQAVTPSTVLREGQEVLFTSPMAGV